MTEFITKSATPIAVNLDKTPIQVLHVDDEPSLLKIAKRCLEVEDGYFQVDTASSVEKAQRMMKKKVYDAIVSDYIMPAKSGLVFLKELRDNGTNVPFIIFTGKGREEVVIKALNLGADQYVSKNGNPETVYGELAHSITHAVKSKRAREMLRESEERYRNLFESAPDAIMTLDLTGVITSCNATTSKLTGYTKEEIIGKHYWNLKFLNARDIPKYRELFALIAGGKIPKPFEASWQRKDGSSSISECHVSLIKTNGTTTGIQVIARNITERRKAEELYRNIVELAPESIITVNKQGVITSCNNAATKMLGYLKEEMVGKHFSNTKIIRAEDLPKFLELFNSVLEEKVEKPLELTFQQKDGTLFVAEVYVGLLKEDSKIVGVQAISQDITPRKKAEAALRESEEKFRNLAEKSPNMIFINKNGKIVYANEKCTKIMGYPKSEFYSPNFDFLTLIAPESRTVVATAFKKHQRGEEVAPYEYTLVTKEGRKIDAIITTSMIRFNGDSAILGIITDITQRKAYEKALQKSEERFRSIVENAHGCIGIVNDAFIIEYVNDQVTSILGYSSEEMIGQDFRKFLHEDSKSLVQERYLRRQKGENVPSAYEFAMVHKNGEKIRVEMKVATIQDNQDRVQTVAEIIDITERTKAKQALVENKEKLEQLFRGNPEAAVYVDSSFEILDINPRFTQLFGFCLEEIKGKRIDDIIVPADKIEEARMLDKKAEGGYVYYDTVRRNKDGSLIPVSISAAPLTIAGRLIGHIALYKDITTQKRIEHELRESRKHFQALFNLMADPVAIVDKKGTILEITEKVEEVTGFKRDELVGRNFLRTKIATKKSKAIMIKNLAKRMLGAHMPPYEVEVLTKKGQVIPYELNATKIEHKGKSADLVVFRDISQRKKMEEKLRVVGKLTRHDIRNKLSAITGNTYLAKKQTTNPQILECFNEIESAVQQAQEIFEFARAYENLGVEKLTLTDVGKSVNNAIAIYGTMNDLTIVNDCSGLLVLADSLLEQILYNLLDNSLKHGENVSQIRIYYTETENHLQLIYEDDGVGIPSSEKEAIFREGYGEDTGYGLYLIRKICEVYGWAIQETGTHHKGAQFTVTIPRLDGDGKKTYRI